MTRKERCLQKLAELTREYEEKLRPNELIQSRLRWEDWETLRKEAVGFAEKEIGCRKWRGKRGGTMPEGHDAESVANQVIEEMMSGRCHLAFGWSRERLVREIQRLVAQRVRVLHRLKEAGAVRSEWDPVNEEGKRKNRLKDVVAEGEDVCERVIEEEEEKRRASVVGEFEKLLKSEPELRAIFGCLCAGLEGSKEIAEKLGMEEAEVVKGRKKLVRRAGMFSRSFLQADNRE